MSDQTVVSTQESTPNTGEAPARKRTTSKSGGARVRIDRKRKVEHSAVIVAFANARAAEGKPDPSAKGLRRVLRAKAPTMPKTHPWRTHAKNAPWPAHTMGDLLDAFPNDTRLHAELVKVTRGQSKRAK
jgi:hypothetical protein